MANTIQIKRKATAGVPSGLAAGELAVNLSDSKLYVGNAAANGVIHLNPSASTSYLPLTGGTLTGDLELGDSDKLTLGAGADLSIYHDGSHSYINETGTGGLIVKGSSLYLRNPSDQDMIYAASGAEVSLYYNNSQKFHTTSTGVKVFGIVNADVLNNAANSANIIYRSGSSTIVGNNASALVVLDNGNTGLGTTSAASLLHLYSSAPVLTIQDGGTHGTNATPYIELKDGSSTMQLIGATSTAGHLDIKQKKAASVRLWTNDAERLTISSTGETKISRTGDEPCLELATDTAGCKLLFARSGDPTAYIRMYEDGSTGSGSLRFATGVSATPVERLKIGTDGVTTLTTAGNTTAGATGYYGSLIINNTGSNTWSRFRFDRSNVEKWGIGVDGSDVFRISNLFTGGTAASPNDSCFVIDNNGQIGINTDPDGGLKIKSRADGENVLNLVDSAGDAMFNIRQSANDCLIRAYKDGGSQQVQIHTDGDSYFNGGNVGIGTAAPSYKLDCRVGSSAIAFAEYGGGATIWMDGDDGDYASGGYFHIQADGTSALRFGYNAVAKMSMSTTGNLELAGTLTATGATLNSDGNGELYVSRSSGAVILTQAQAAAGKFGTTSNHDLQLMTNNTVYARLTNDGKFGVGIDPATSIHTHKTSGHNSAYITTDGTSSSNAALWLAHNYTAAADWAGIVWGTDNLLRIVNSGASSSNHIVLDDTGHVSLNSAGLSGYGHFGVAQPAGTDTDGIAVVNGTTSFRLWVDDAGMRRLNAGSTSVVEFNSSSFNVSQPTTITKDNAYLLDLYRPTTGATNASFLSFDLNNNAGTPERITYGLIGARIVDHTDGSEDGELVFRTMLNGTLATRLTVGNDSTTTLTTAGNTTSGATGYYGSLIINNTGSNTWSRFRFDRSNVEKWGIGVDGSDVFRISNLFTSGTAASPNDNCFVINNSSNVGINCTPSYRLQVNGDVRVNSGSVFLDDTQPIRWGGTKAKIVGSNGGDYLKFYTDATERVTIASNGKVTFAQNIDFASQAPYITFYGGGHTEHAIGSRNSSGNAADDLRINTFGGLFVNLDSNNNNTSGADFSIGRHGQSGAITDWLLEVSGETGQLKLNKYGGSGLTGTVAKYLAVDSSGNVIQTSSSFNGGTIGSDLLISTSSDPALSFVSAESGTDDWKVYVAGTGLKFRNTTDSNTAFELTEDNNAVFSGTITGHGSIDLQDNDKLLLGAGNDLEIYHDGSNSYVHDNGTGDLILKGDNVRIKTGAANDDVFRSYADGAVELYHNDVKKFETSSSGGVLTGASGRTTLTLIGAKTANGNFGDILGSNNSDTGRAQISFRRDDNNDATAILFYTEATGASMTEKLRLTSTGRLGVSTAAPDATLDVSGDAIVRGNLYFDGVSSSYIDNSSHEVQVRGANGVSLWSYYGAGWTERLTVADAGDCGFGTAAPECGIDLHKAAVGGLRLNIHNSAVETASDASISFETQGQMDWGMGIDRSDSGKFKIGHHPTIGSDTVLTLDPSNNATTLSGNLSLTNSHLNLSHGYSLQWDNSHERIESTDSTLKFFTNNTQQMTLSGSFLGIGTAATISSSNELLGLYSAGAGHACFRNSSDSTGTVYVRNVSQTANTWQPYLILADSGGNRGGLALKYSTAGLKLHGQGGIEFWTGSSFGGGSKKFEIDSNGAANFTQSSTYGIKLTYSNGNTSGIVDSIGGNLEFRVQNSQKLILNSSGGTITGTLQVTPAASEQGITIGDASKGEVPLIFKGSGGSTSIGQNGAGFFISENNAGNLDSSPRFVIDTNGNCGLGGVTAPDSKLEIAGGGWNSSLKIKGSGSHTGIQFEDSSGNTDGYIYAIDGNLGFLDAGGDWTIQCKNDDYIRFATNGNTERMRITSTGTTLSGDLTVQKDVGRIHVRSNDYLNCLLGNWGSSGANLDAGYLALYNSGNEKIRLTTIADSYIRSPAGTGLTIGEVDGHPDQNALRIAGYSTTSNYGSYGGLLFHATAGHTSSARRFLLTNAYGTNKFAIIRSSGATTDPDLGGTADFMIYNDGNIKIQNALGLGRFPSARLDILDPTDGGISWSTFLRVGRRGGHGTNELELKSLHDGSDEVDGFAVFLHNTECLAVDNSKRLFLNALPPDTYAESTADDFVLGNTGDHGGITIRSGTAHAGSIYFADGVNGNQKYRGFVEYNHNTEVMTLGAAGSSKFRINSTGIGILCIPSYALHVNGNTAFSNGSTVNIGTTGSNTGKLRLYNNNSTAYYVDYKSNGARTYQFEGSSSSSDYATTFDNAGSGGHNLNVAGILRVKNAAGNTNQFILSGGVFSWGGSANAGQMSWDTGKAYLYGQSGHALCMGANGNGNQFTIATSGAVFATGSMVVGSGGNATLHTRHVDGKSHLNDNDSSLHLNYDTGYNVLVGSSSANANFYTYGSAYITSKCGVGTTAPDAEGMEIVAPSADTSFNVNDQSDSMLVLRNSDSGSINTGRFCAIQMKINSSSAAAEGTIRTQFAGDGDADLIFSTTKGGTGYDRMTLDEDGHLSLSGNLTLNSRITFSGGSSQYLEIGTNSIALKNSGGTVLWNSSDSGSGSGTVSSSDVDSGTTDGNIAVYTASTTVKQAPRLFYNGSDHSLTINKTSTSGVNENLHVVGDAQITTRLGVGTGPNSSYSAYFNGATYAYGDVGGTSKSFKINHPTKEGMKLRHSSLEGPEIGVYQRGEVQGDTIDLPDYWAGLVRDGTVTVQLTPKGSFQQLYVISASNVEVKIGEANGADIDCYYTIYGERADVERYDVEYEGDI